MSKELRIVSGAIRTAGKPEDGWELDLAAGSITYVDGNTSFIYPVELGLKVWAYQYTKDETNVSDRCPIGLDHASTLCSASSCKKCLVDRLKFYQDEDRKHLEKIDHLEKIIKYVTEYISITESDQTREGDEWTREELLEGLGFLKANVNNKLNEVNS